MTPFEMAKIAESQGFRVKRTKKGFMIFGKPGSGQMVTLHLTCSDWRAEKNAVNRLRRLGVKV